MSRRGSWIHACRWKKAIESGGKFYFWGLRHHCSDVSWCATLSRVNVFNKKKLVETKKHRKIASVASSWRCHLWDETWKFSLQGVPKKKAMLTKAHVSRLASCSAPSKQRSLFRTGSGLEEGEQEKLLDFKTSSVCIGSSMTCNQQSARASLDRQRWFNAVMSHRPPGGQWIGSRMAPALAKCLGLSFTVAQDIGAIQD